MEQIMTDAKCVTIDEFLVKVIRLLQIDIKHPLVMEFIDGDYVNISIEEFLNLVLKTKGWHQTVAETTDFVIRQKMFSSGRTPTKESIEDAKNNVLYFWQGITIDAYKCGYEF